MTFSKIKEMKNNINEFDIDVLVINIIQKIMFLQMDYEKKNII